MSSCVLPRHSRSARSAFSPLAILSMTCFGMSSMPSANLFARPRNQARSTEGFVGFPCLGGKYFVLLARKDSDLALIGLFKPNIHVTRLLVVISAASSVVTTVHDH